MTSLFLVFEPREAFKIKARAAAEESLRLNRELGEGHMALGSYFDYVDRTYDAAAREYEIARRVLPNNSVLIRRIGLMKRRQGHWRDGLADAERAASLDPRNLLSLGWLAGTYEDVHDWPRAEEIRRRCLAGALNDYPHETPAQEKFQLGFSRFLGTEEANKRGLRTVDVFELSKKMRDGTSLVAPDGLHPSAKEYAEWKKIIFPAVVELLRRPP